MSAAAFRAAASSTRAASRSLVSSARSAGVRVVVASGWTPPAKLKAKNIRKTVNRNIASGET